jgi:hypothetical protein
MGNLCDSRLVPTDLPDAENLQFFLKLGVKWLEIATAQLQERTAVGLSLKHPSPLSWRDYFTVFKSIKEDVIKTNESLEKKSWHPACMGYAMKTHSSQEDDIHITQNDDKQHQDIDDDFTNDDASEDSSSTHSSTHPSHSVPNHHSPKNMNSQFTNPIFFGYSTELESVHRERIQAHVNAAKEREKRALGKAMQARSAVVDSLEKKSEQQHNLREKKIEELKQKFEREQKKRDDKYNASVGQLSGDVLRVIQVNFLFYLFSS